MLGEEDSLLLMLHKSKQGKRDGNGLIFYIEIKCVLFRCIA